MHTLDQQQFFSLHVSNVVFHLLLEHDAFFKDRVAGSRYSVPFCLQQKDPRMHHSGLHTLIPSLYQRLLTRLTSSSRSCDHHANEFMETVSFLERMLSSSLSTFDILTIILNEIMQLEYNSLMPKIYSIPL